MPMTYADERAVFYNPSEVRPTKCLKCAQPTTRISPRSLTARAPAMIGTVRLVTARHVLVLCERCDRMWSHSAGIGLLLVFMPLWIIPALMAIDSSVVKVPGQVIAGGFGLSIVVAIAAYIWARSKLIQTYSIDDDGTLGLKNVHPETIEEIVSMGT